MRKTVKICDLIEDMIRLFGMYGVRIIETRLKPREKFCYKLLFKVGEFDKTEHRIISIERNTATKEDVFRRLPLLQDAYAYAYDYDMACKRKTEEVNKEANLKEKAKEKIVTH